MGRVVRIGWLLLAVVAAVGTAVAAEEPLSVYFVDVGQGNATLVHQPGKCSMLVDAGPAEQGESLRTIIEKRNITTLDYVVITHPHPDHYVGLQIVSDIDISELSDNGDQGLAREGFEDYRKLQEELPYSVLAAGDGWRCGDLDIAVLHPSPDFAGNGDANVRSLVLRIGYNGFRLLLLGDLATIGEQHLLASNADLQATVVQVGHHGAADATSIELLERIQPQIALVSVGRENDIMAPAPEVLGRLAAKAMHTLRTDLRGTVHLRVSPNGSMRLTQ